MCVCVCGGGGGASSLKLTPKVHTPAHELNRCDERLTTRGVQYLEGNPWCMVEESPQVSGRKCPDVCACVCWAGPFLPYADPKVHTHVYELNHCD